MSIPAVNITEAHIASELSLSGQMTGEQMAQAMFGSISADVTSENLAGFEAWSFQWSGPTTLGGSQLGPGARGSGVRFSSGGSWEQLYSGSIAGSGRWISLPEGDVTGADYQVAWDHISGLAASLSISTGWNENVYMSLSDVKYIGITTGSSLTKVVDFKFRKTGDTVDRFTQRVTLHPAG